MKNLSVKTKIFITLIGMTVTGLMAFGYMTFSTYKKDKLAYVYEQILGRTKDLSHTMKTVSEKYDVLLGSTITTLKNSRSSLNQTTQKYLRDSGSAQFIGLQLEANSKNARNVLFGKDEGGYWEQASKLPEGIHPLDFEQSKFLYKRNVQGRSGFSFVVFENPSLSHALSSQSSQAVGLFRDEGIFTNSQWEGARKLLSSAAEKMGPSAFSQYGLKELELNGEDYLAAYAKNSDGSVFYSLTKLQDVLLVQKVFTAQLLGFLSLMSFISLLVGVIASGRLTRYLRELTQAAKDMEREEFKHELRIKSGDEFEVLGSAFVSMSSRIQKLLAELRAYNTQLEEMVAERTAQLQKVTNIQKAMLNALGQAFVIVDENKKVLPVYSKAAEEMLETRPDEADFLELLKVDDGQKDVMNQFFEHVFKGELDFDTMAKLAPAERTNSKNRRIFFEYAPIKNEESGQMSYMMLVGTDRTEEIENREKFEAQWKFSRMIMGIVKDRQGFLRVLEDARKMLKEAKELWKAQGTEALIDIQRRLHTVKGNFGFFYIDSITGPAGEAESGIEQLLKDDSKTYDVGQAIVDVAESIERFASEQRDLVGESSANGRVVSEEAIRSFESRLTDKELAQIFRESFYQAKVGDYFASYPEYAKNIARRLGKKVRFELKGADVAAVEGPWTEVLSELIHVLRNSLDHGIEPPSKRLAAGKPEEGLLRFSFGLEEHKGERCLKAVLEDDGKGIDVQALAKKDPRIQDMDSAIQFLASGGLSSREQATDLSGRGVGLSAVVQKTVRLGGHWKVESKEGEGTVIELLIPLESQDDSQERAA